MNLKKSWQNFVTKKKRMAEIKKKLQAVQLEKEECVNSLESEQSAKQSL
jgi:predicted nuclease with TOPRIM domain